MKKLYCFFKEKQGVSSRNEGLLVNDLKKENDTTKNNDELNDIVLKFTNGKRF